MMNSNKHYFITFLLTCLLLSACGASSGVPKTWIDKPLNNTIVPLAPFFIMAHASDSDGVASIEFHVNGQLIKSATPFDGAGVRLGHVETIFTPAGLGEYRIEVHAVDSAGNAGYPAVAKVIVAGEIFIPDTEELPPDPPPQDDSGTIAEAPAPPPPAEEPPPAEVPAPVEVSPPAEEPAVDIISPETIDTTPPGIFGGAAADKNSMCPSEIVTANILTGDEESPVKRVFANWILTDLNGNQIESGYEDFTPIAGQPYGYTAQFGPFGGPGTLTINGTVENSLNPPLSAYFSLVVTITLC
jgi:hypothetical protein